VRHWTPTRTRRPLVLVPLLLALAACSSTSPGWTFAPAPSPTPVPSASGDASAAPSGEPSAEPSDGGGGTVVQLSATNIAWDQATLTAPAGVAFQIELANNDPSVPHNVEIIDSNGEKLFVSETFPGVETRTFDVPPLEAGTYEFICIVHPNMTGILTAS
jgi:plastocyanin